MTVNQPFFSIIVAAFNAEDTIEATVSSVLSQTFTDYEIVVKDGGSTDGTLEKIPASDKVRVESRADGGIYGGMNEGIALARGNYLCFLNCGDIFADNEVLAKFHALARDLDGNRRILYGNYMRGGVLFKQPSALSPAYLYRTPLCHQSMFFGRAIFDEFGGYDTQYHILADYNHTLTAFFADVPFIYGDFPVCDYLGGGASETKNGVKVKKKEYRKVRATHYTRAQILKNDVKIFLSFRRLRQALISDKSPAFIRRAYRAFVNKINH